jgi:hypothetical protein
LAALLERRLSAQNYDENVGISQAASKRGGINGDKQLSVAKRRQ